MYHSIQELQDHRDLEVMQDPYKNKCCNSNGTELYCHQTKISMEKKSANKYVLVPYTK